MAVDNVAIPGEEESLSLLGCVSCDLLQSDLTILIGAILLAVSTLPLLHGRFARLLPAPLIAIFLAALVSSYFDVDGPQANDSALTAAGQFNAESNTQLVFPMTTTSLRPCLERNVVCFPVVQQDLVDASPGVSALPLRGPPAV